MKEMKWTRVEWIRGLRIQKIGGKVCYMTRNAFSCEELADIVCKCVAVEIKKVIFFSPEVETH
jgi:hypothetical protein